VSSIGQLFRLFSDELGPAGFVLLVLAALLLIWLGFRHARPR
jgi:hypothetical protein